MPRLKQSARPSAVRAPKRTIPCKAARKTVQYSTHRDICFETDSECEIFKTNFGDDYGKTSSSRKEAAADEYDDDDDENATRSKRPRLSSSSGAPDTPSMRLSQTANLIESMESYILDIHNFLNTCGISGAPVLPRDVAEALSISDHTPAEIGRVATTADADVVAARLKAGEIDRELSAQYNRIFQDINTAESSFRDLEKILEDFMQQIYELSKVEDEIILMASYNLVTQLAVNCIYLPESPHHFPYEEHELVLRFIEPADVLAKHCALKLWKNNWDKSVAWDQELKTFRSDSIHAEQCYSRTNYMQRTIDFIERVRGA